MYCDSDEKIEITKHTKVEDNLKTELIQNNSEREKNSIVNIKSLQNESELKNKSSQNDSTSEVTALDHDSDTEQENESETENNSINQDHKSVPNESQSKIYSNAEVNKLKHDGYNARNSIVMTKISRTVTVDEVRNMLKRNVTEEMYKNIEDMYVDINELETQCIIKFKSEIIAAEARFKIDYIKRKHPHFTVKRYGEVLPTNKRLANNDISPVPQKIQKLDDKAFNTLGNPKRTQILFMNNVPIKWKRTDVLTFIKKHTKQVPEVLIGLIFIFFDDIKNQAKTKVKLARCHLYFENENLCELACRYLRKAERRFDGELLTIDYEYPDSDFAAVWLPCGRPDMVATKMKRKIQNSVVAIQEWPLNQDHNKQAQDHNKQAQDLNKQAQDHNKQAQDHNKQALDYNKQALDYNKQAQDQNKQPQDHNKQALDYNKQAQDHNNVIPIVNKKIAKSPTGVKFVYHNVNPNDTYGLSPQFLECLGIKPPLTTKICVDNLTIHEYNDEAKIRKLFSHAGTVTDVVFIHKYPEKLFIKVDYDHPVEAVQAISMFHNKEVYGMNLIVTMDRSRHAYKTYFPPGLKGFGPGLNPGGTPMKNVRNTIEQQRNVDMLLSRIDGLQQTIESLQQSIKEINEEVKNNVKQAGPNAVQNQVASVANSSNNTLLALSALLNPQAAQLMQLLKQDNAGNIVTPALTPIATLNQQPQDANWNANRPGPTHIQGANVQPGQNVQPFEQQMQSVVNLNSGLAQLGSGSGTFVKDQFAQGGQSATGQFTQGQAGPSSSTGQFQNVQTGPLINVPTGRLQNMPTGQLQNVPIGQFQNVPTGQLQNVPTGQLQNVPTGQIQNVPTGQFVQSGPNSAIGQHGQNVTATTYYDQGSTAVVGQFGQNRQNEPFVQRVANTAPVQYGQNVPTGQFAQGSQNVPAGYRWPNAPYNQEPGTSQGAKNAGIPKRGDPCTVQFSYLPPSVTLSSLNIKMREVGEIRFSEMIGPGRALVTFYSPRDADNCIELLDHTKVDGQTIEVKFF